MQVAAALLVLFLGFANYHCIFRKKFYIAENQEGLFVYAADTMRKHRDSRTFFRLALQLVPRCRSPPLLNLILNPKFRRNGGVPDGIQLCP